MPINIRQKGAQAEREVAKIHNKFFAANGFVDSCGEPLTLKRNQMQTFGGGYDLVGIPFLALEVKRQEKLSMGVWWRQTLRQTKQGQTPVLFYRQSRKPWEIRVPENIFDLDCNDCGYSLDAKPVTIIEYFEWLKLRLDNDY